ncbi:hypothetical protein L7F22_048113 [Adiantum nelumboides]|nr:hypothetical protein [Adiantum nelumboides]
MKLRLPSLTKATHSLPCCKRSNGMSSQTRNAASEPSLHKANKLLCNKWSRKPTSANKQGPLPLAASMQQMNAMEMQEMKEAFDFFDENNDGKITVGELGMALRKLGDNLTEKQVREMVKEVDTNGDGVISFEEFMSLQPFVRGICQQVVDDGGKAYHEDMREAFLRFDANKDGRISPQELQGIMAQLGRSWTLDECCRMIKYVDHDGDGYVSFEEFQLMMA